MKKFLIVLVAIAALMLTASLAAAQDGLPGAGWNSGQQIQNIDTSSGSIMFTAYDKDGNASACGSAKTLDPGESYTYLTDIDCTVAAGFIGSAVVSADVDIAAVVNVNNKGVGAASGQYRGTSGLDVATTLSFPLIKSDHVGRTTTFFIQNASDLTNDITVVFTVNGVDYTETYDDVPANAMVVVVPSAVGVPTGNNNIGGLTVTGTQPLAGASLEHVTAASVSQNLQASKAFTPSEYDTTVYCPLLRNAYGSKLTTTGLQVQNVTTASTFNITVNYAYVGGGSKTVTVNNVGPGESANFLQSVDLPAGTLASATITAGGNIAAIVNDKATATDPQRVTTYACFGASSATSKINLPLVKEDFGGSVVNTTGIQVQNVGLSATTVTLVYNPDGGSAVTLSHTDTIQPGSSKTFYRVANGGTAGLTGSPGSLDGTVNGVVITSNNGQPVVAIANESSLTGALQDTKNYEGFNVAP